MKRILFLCLLGLVACIGCSLDMSILIAGDAEAVDAEIYIDGERVGVMEKRVHTTGEAKLNIRPGDIYSYGEIEVPAGKHTITFVSKEGERLEKEITVKRGENYMGVSFEKMEIRDK